MCKNKVWQYASVICIILRTIARATLPSEAMIMKPPGMRGLARSSAMAEAAAAAAAAAPAAASEASAEPKQGANNGCGNVVWLLMSCSAVHRR
jgi:hypothetical protein